MDDLSELESSQADDDFQDAMDDIGDPPLPTLPALEDHPVLVTSEGDATPREPADPTPLTSLSQKTSLLPSFIQNFSPAPAIPKSSDETPDSVAQGGNQPEGKDEPSTMSGLSQYVLMVGFGVCVVAIRVMLKRIGGRGGGFKA